MLFMTVNVDTSHLNKEALKTLHDWITGKSNNIPDAWTVSTFHKLVQHMKNSPATNLTLGTLALTTSREDKSLWIARFPDGVEMPPTLLAQPQLWNVDLQPLTADRLKALDRLAALMDCETLARLPVTMKPSSDQPTPRMEATVTPFRPRQPTPALA